MNTEYFEHIGLYKDVYPQGYCQHLIMEFDRLEAKGVGANRQKGEGAFRHAKNDYSISADLGNHVLNLFNDKDPASMFFDGLQECYDDYTTKYSTLKTNGNIRATAMKMQKTSSGGGYHVWHAEQGPGAQANRAVVYMLYLNTLRSEDGAETEFLHQRKRFSPLENMMVIWPAAYTHAHRGNPVLGIDAKYIVTGWFYYD
jgi:hypothetical protein